MSNWQSYENSIICQFVGTINQQIRRYIEHIKTIYIHRLVLHSCSKDNSIYREAPISFFLQILMFPIGLSVLPSSN